VVPGAADPAAFDWPTAAEHCRLAWLRGRFLAAGSLSVAGGRTHLEFVVAAEEAPRLAARLAELGLPARWRIRRGRGVVVWKRRETVTTFLRRIGATASVLELEARAVSRALRGDLNRILNAESANLVRSVEAAWRQLAAIDALDADGRLARCSPRVRAVAAARRAAPEASLTELADSLGFPRAAVQRALEGLVRLAEGGGGAPGSSRRRAPARRLPWPPEAVGGPVRPAALEPGRPDGDEPPGPGLR
ncbi:MAG TPA: DNA-binding protein WhiA, partial [Candidatus Binatia bacterium]|nr:DNA-binding protein WhiA [Candidatus Binatia bacterium]